MWLPETITDEQAIMISDIYPTAWFGCRLAEVARGDTVLVLGAGPVGQFAVTSAFQQGAGRVLCVDGVKSRLEQARGRGAECIDFNEEDPVAVVQELTGGIGVDRVVDAVGVDAQRPKSGPAAEKAAEQASAFEQERATSPRSRTRRGRTGCRATRPARRCSGPWRSVAKAGTIGIIGVYSPQLSTYPIGQAMNKNLTVKAGNCNHRRYLPRLVDLVRTGAIDPASVLTQDERVTSVLEAYATWTPRAEGTLRGA